MSQMVTGNLRSFSGPDPAQFCSVGGSTIPAALGQSASEFSSKPKRVAQQIIDALTDARADGVMATETSLNAALRFGEAMPADWPVPSVVVESDGEIVFDWVLGKSRMLTIGFRSDQRLGYSVLIGTEPTFGHVAFASVIPLNIDFFMRRLKH